MIHINIEEHNKEETLYYLRSIRKVLLDNHGGSQQDLGPEILEIGLFIKQIEEQS